MTPTVLDAYALLVYIQKEAGYEVVRDLLAAAVGEGTTLLMTTVNMGEVYYKTLRVHGAKGLCELEERLEELPIEVIPADMALAKEAAGFKATKRMSFADCFAVALAQARSGRVVTGDRKFREIEPEVPILWLGKPG